jgi:hypothetical protein
VTRWRRIAAALLAAAACANAQAQAPDHRESWSLFFGKYTDDPLAENILAFVKPIDFDPAWITVFTYGRLRAKPAASRRWEGELQFGVHTGRQDNYELNAAVFHRWYDWPWDGLLTTSLALGGGLSWANRVPFLESQVVNPDKSESRLLLYLGLELEVAPHWARDWSLYARIHHRSGVFGTFNGVHGGSDHIGLGLRWYFPR